MSGFALCFHRDARPATAATVAEMLAAMDYLGRDGRRIETRGSAVLGHLHFWTTPEEVGERQPLVHAQAALTLVWDGRLDNRREVYRQLGGDLPPLAQLSDAQLVLQAWAQYGPRCVPRLLGPFALAVYDHAQRELVLACDPMGGRNIYYALSGRVLIAASEPGGVLAHPELEVAPDPGPLAMYFAYSERSGADTFFAGVRVLLPAQVLRVIPDRVRYESFWPFDPAARLRYRNEDEYAEQFHELLSDSVACRLRTQHEPAVAMSGGLDSAPIAALAARHLSARGRRLIAASWVFDRFSACDEREYLEPMYRAHGLTPLQVNCDAAWPLSDFKSWPIHPFAPFQNPYRRFHQELYQALQQRGVGVALTGLMGDHLYRGSERWLADLLREGRLGNAFAEGLWFAGQYGWRALLRRGLVRGLVPHRVYRRLRPRAVPPWLTPFARRHLNRGDAWPGDSPRARRPEQYFGVLALVAGVGFQERFFCNPYGIELRYPFRDRRLVEFMLKIPTDQLVSRGITRPIIRRGLREVVPEAILSRRHKTSFGPVYAYGMCEQELTRVNQWLDPGNNAWSRYVDPGWLAAHRECRGENAYIAWLCVSLEMWSRYTPAGFAFRDTAGPC